MILKKTINQKRHFSRPKPSLAITCPSLASRTTKNTCKWLFFFFSFLMNQRWQDNQPASLEGRHSCPFLYYQLKQMNFGHMKKPTAMLWAKLYLGWLHVELRCQQLHHWLPSTPVILCTFLAQVAEFWWRVRTRGSISSRSCWTCGKCDVMMLLVPHRFLSKHKACLLHSAVGVCSFLPFSSCLSSS